MWALYNGGGAYFIHRNRPREAYIVSKEAWIHGARELEAPVWTQWWGDMTSLLPAAAAAAASLTEESQEVEKMLMRLLWHLQWHLTYLQGRGDEEA